MSSLGVPPRAIPAWQRLTLAIHGAQHPIPCTGPRADLWTSERADEREAASHRCSTCPAIAECHDYAVAANEKHNVWAGVDRTRHDRKATA